MFYIIQCPNCRNQDVKEIDSHVFECECGEQFDIENAVLDELEYIG